MQANQATDSLQIYVAWKNVSFKVADTKSDQKNAKKVILENLNGCVKPGELVAVIGPSGSGKSSFLNCIAGRNSHGVTGDILFNDAPRPVNFSRFTGYVVQDDVYFASLTVYETLKFAANLKLPATLSEDAKLKRVHDILDELDLNKCRDTVIGTIGCGISGGERRRLAIGLEILNEPSLLLLDEPTSGLDSASALMVGKILKKLADKRKIGILCTIHQPRYSLATMFDKLYFLAKGRELYFGPTIPHCLQFFEDAGYKCPAYDNPADFLLDLVNTSDLVHDDDELQVAEDERTKVVVEDPKSKPNDDDTEQTQLKIDQAADKVKADKVDNSRQAIIMKLAAAYQASEYRQKALDYEVPTSLHGDIVFPTLTKELYITPIWNQIFVITKRTFIHKVREPAALMTQVFNAIVIPLLFGSIYWQLDLSYQSSYDRISALSLLTLTLSFFPFDILMLFPLEREICNREQSAGMYRSISFFIGRIMAETPGHIILSAVMATITYWMYGMQDDATKFAEFVLIVVSTVMASSGLLILFSTLAKNIEQSNLLFTFFVLLFMLFDGNWISLDKVPIYWRWIQHLSYLGYGSQAAIVNEYEGLLFECTPKEIEEFGCMDVSGDDILYNRGLEDVDVYFNILALWILAVVYRIFAFVSFWLFYRSQPPKQIVKNLFSS